MMHWTSNYPYKYLLSFYLFGIYLYDLWGYPNLSHQSAMEVIAMESNLL
jgi:hypothetical protein